MPHSSKRFAEWFCCAVGDSLFCMTAKTNAIGLSAWSSEKFNIPVENNFTTFVPWKIIEAGSVSLTSFQRDNSFVCAKTVE